MRPRHRVPTVFSLAMVDVLCCALGCVILIWLLNSKLSDDEAVETKKETTRLLEEARKKKEESDLLLAAALKDTKNLDKRYQLILADRDKAAALAKLLAEKVAQLDKEKKGLTLDLDLAKEKVLDVTGKLKLSDRKSDDLEKALLELRKNYDAEKVKLVALDKRLVDLLARIKTTEEDLEATRKTGKEEKVKAEDLKKALELKEKDLLALMRLLEEAKQARKLLDDALGKKDTELLLAKEKRLDLEKLLALRKEAIDDAARIMKKLEKEKLILRLAAENRFAGIELTGKRVIFLVDMSGSMKEVAHGKASPNKWLEVRQTVAKLMRSLSLEKYQLITFASEASYPLGSKGRWLTYDRTEGPEAVLKALAAIDPKGGTNMYEALEEAFKYRKDGLETIYLLSDGLPNMGKGLTVKEMRGMSEIDRGMALGKHVLTTLRTDWNRTATTPRVRINTIGFFYESPDLGAFLWALARDNDGSFVGMSKP